MGLWRDRTGVVVEIDDAYARGQGFTPVSDAEVAAGIEQEAIDSRSDGFLGGLNAAATGLLSGATLGLSDVALSAVSTEGERERIRQDRETHEGISTAAELVGGLAPALASPASVLGRTPAGYLAQSANRAAEASRALGGVRALAGTAAATGAEAAAQNAGSYISDVALGDRELTAEGMAGALGTGFLFGSVAGGAVYGLEKGTIAARRMFARTADGGDSALKLAESTFERKSDEIIQANDATYEQAKARLQEIQNAKLAAQDARARAGADLAQAKLDRFNEPPPVTVADDALPSIAADAPAPPAPVETPAPIAAAATPLERQLAEMQGQLDAGKSLQDLNAQRTANPAALADEEAKLTDAIATYEQRKAAINEWTERLRNPRVSRDIEGPNVTRGRRSEALPEDVMVERSTGRPITIGKMEHTLDDLTENSRILAGPNGPKFSVGARLDDEYDDLIEMAHRAEAPEDVELLLQEAADVERQIHDYVREHKPQNAEVIDRIEALRAQSGKTGVDAARRRLERRIERDAAAVEPRLARVDPEAEAAYQRTLAGQEGRGPNDLSWMDEFTRQRMDAQGVAPRSIVDDVDEASKVIGEYEKAAADLTDAVGDAASPAAKESRDALRAAEAEAERKAVDRAARAVDDAADEAARVPTPAERIKAAKQAKLEADATLAKLAIDERAVKAEIKGLGGRKGAKKKAPEVPAPELPTPETQEARGRFGGIADMGAALEAANTIGIPGLPKPSDLPIIGPVLGLYLKFRALKAVAGRMTGRVPATGDARAAALAAKTRDKAAKAVDRLLGLAERSAPRARQVAAIGGPRMLDVLSKRIHDDGEPDAPKGANAQQLAAVRARELANAVANPGAMLANLRRELRDVTDPDLIKAAEDLRIRQVQHLNEHAPKGPPPTPLIQRPWVPTLAEASIFARRLAVANDPVAAIEAVEQKCLTPEAADTLRAVYPKLFAQVQTRLLERSTEIKQTLPYEQRIRMSLLFDVPLDPSLEPATIALLQTAHATPAATTSVAAPPVNQPPVPSTAGPVDLTALYQSPSDRRAARR